MKRIILVLLLLLLVACAPKNRVVQKVHGGKPPAKLAILPSANLTNDVLGAMLIRNLVYEKLQENNKGYEIQDIALTDSLLLSEGISEGGLLNIMTNLQLCQLLEVDGLLYVDVYDMGMKILPFYHSRYVDFQVRLYSFSRLVWQKPVNIANRVIDVEGAIGALDSITNGQYDEALVDAGSSVAVQAAVKIGTATIADHELKPEFIMGVDEFFRDIPFGTASDMDYLVEVNESLEKLTLQKENGEELDLGEELILEEEEISVEEKGINWIE